MASQSIPQEKSSESTSTGLSDVNVWGVGYMWDRIEDKSPDFLAKGIWQNGKDKVTRKLGGIETGDVFILKTSYVNRAKRTNFLRIRAVGIVQGKTSNPNIFLVNWLAQFDERPEFENLGHYSTTLDRISQEHAKMIIYKVAPEVMRLLGSDIPPRERAKYASTANTIINSISEGEYLNASEIAALFTNILIKSTGNAASTDAQEDRFYGVFGQWGRGKTHFWGKVKNLLQTGENKEKFKTVAFHAWKYQDTPAIWAYLYETLAGHYYYKKDGLVNELVGGIVNPFKALKLNFYRDTPQVLFGVASLVLLIANLLLFPVLTKNGSIGTQINQFLTPDTGFAFPIGAFTTLAFLISATTAIYKFKKNPIARKATSFMSKYGKRTSFKQHLGLQHEMQEELVYLLRAWIGNSDKKVVLFIDDIDRCSYGKIIDIVDSIRVMLNNNEIQKRIIVIAAIDERILFRAIFKKYEPFIEATRLNNLCIEYFDKLFIAGIKLNPLDESMKEEMISGFIEKEKPKEENKGVEIVEDDPDDDENFDNFNSRNSTPKDESSTESTQFTEKEINWLKEEVRQIKDATPRSIRNFTIKYRMARDLVQLQWVKKNTGDVSELWGNDEMHKQELIKQIRRIMNREEPRYSDTVEELRSPFEQAVEMVTFYPEVHVQTDDPGK
uniref:P-loop NTPase fold protein n=2 Tax=Roseivirga sp. TaxID=1964215 RepID=UPI00404719DD